MKNTIKRTLLRILEADGTTYVGFWRKTVRTCSACGFEGRFKPFGVYYVRPDARCPSCGSLERHRQMALFFEEFPDMLSSDADLLHFAPETVVSNLIKNRVKTYVTADLNPDHADKVWNIEDIDCEDDAFDVVVCSHVLEHVDPDKALKEIRRVLRPGGCAILMVPICEGLDVTYEDDSVTTRQGRWMHFQQADHTRVFGRDFRQMVTNAGFTLEEHVAQGKAAVKYGLVMGERIFIAKT